MLFATPIVEVQSSPQEHEVPSADLFQLIYSSNVVNFIFVVFFITWVLKKAKVGKMISDKVATVISSIRDAEEKKVKAELELDAVEKKVRRSSSEAEKIVISGKEVGESLVSRIKKDTELAVQDVGNRADRAIDAQRDSSSSKLSKNASSAAFALAEEHIKNSIDEELHKKYINEFIDSLSEMKVQ